MIVDIKEVLTEMGLTQHELSRRVDIREDHLNRILNGHIRPRVDLALRIAKELGRPAEELWPEPEKA